MVSPSGYSRHFHLSYTPKLAGIRFEFLCIYDCTYEFLTFFFQESLRRRINTSEQGLIPYHC